MSVAAMEASRVCFSARINLSLLSNQCIDNNLTLLAKACLQVGGKCATVFGSQDGQLLEKRTVPIDLVAL